MKIILMILPVLLSAFLSGCFLNAKTYKGPELPKDKISIVTTHGNLISLGSWRSGPFEVITTYKDGKNTNKDNTVGNTLYMLPGEYKLIVNCNYNAYQISYSGAPEISITLEKGFTYHIECYDVNDPTRSKTSKLLLGRSFGGKVAARIYKKELTK